jgi:hypothetical protein
MIVPTMRSRLVQASVALAAALLFATAPARATTSVTMDGVWWQGLSQLEKVVAVQGIINGIGMGYVLGHTAGRTDTYTLFKIPTETLLSTIQAGRVPPDSQNAPEFSKTFGVYVDEINVWYEAHPHSSMRPDGLLGMCFADKPVYTMEICEKMGAAAK